MIRSPAGFGGEDRIKRYLDYYQPSYGVMMLSAGQAFSPASLFAAGEQGVWYDPSDFSTMFQDSAGTTPVTAVEQPVGRILDKSGRGNHATQSTSASRPVLSARVNLLTKTEQFDDAVWAKAAGVSVPVTNNLAPDGTLTADTITSTAGNQINQTNIATIVGATYTTSAWIKKTIGATVFPMLVLNGTAVFGQVILNTNTGVANVRSGVPGATNVVVTDAVDYWRLSFSTVPNSTISSVLFYAAASTDGTSYTGGLSASHIIWGADLRVTNDGVGIPAYQRVNTSTDYDTTGFPYYLRFDGTDDSMATGTITPGIDKAQVFAGVRKLSDATSAILLESSVNAGANNGALYVVTGPDPLAANRYSSVTKGSATVTPSNIAITNLGNAPDQAVLSTTHDIAGDLTTIRRNGVAGTSSTVDLGTGNFLAYPLYIGSRAGSSSRFNGRIYSLIVRFGANLDATTITNTETWVNGKTYAYA